MTVADPLLEAMLSRMAGPPPVVPDVSTQFANPYHDELGRFARKGEGRRVPTKGVEDSATIPDKTSLSGQPELKEAFTRAIYEGSKIGGNTPSAHTDQFQDILPTGFDVDGEEYDVAWSLWSRDADYPQLVFHGTITDADGRWAGDTMRAFARDLQEDSEIYAYHDRLSIRQGVQGQGIGTSFLAACEAAYVKAGINEIRLHANLDVGGYAWARAGFDFETADQAAITVDDMLTYTDPDYTVNADGLPDEYQETLTDIRRRIVTEGVVPTPYELSRIGYDQRRIRRDGSETWWAKEVMMDLEWDAKKILTPAVPVAVAAAAGMSRVEFLQALGALHLRHSLAHATDAPPAPDRKDGSLWNLDYWAPDEFEAEFQAAAAQLLAAYRGPETFATMKARLYAQFANPYHDERGRFAPKNTGRRVPTKGVDGDDGIPAKTSLSGQPEPKVPLDVPKAAVVPLDGDPKTPGPGTTLTWADGSTMTMTTHGAPSPPWSGVEVPELHNAWIYVDAQGRTTEVKVFHEAAGAIKWTDMPNGRKIDRFAADFHLDAMKKCLDAKSDLVDRLGMDPVGMTFGHPATEASEAATNSKDPSAIHIGAARGFRPGPRADRPEKNLNPPLYLDGERHEMTVMRDVSQAEYIVAHELGHIRFHRGSTRPGTITRTLAEAAAEGKLEGKYASGSGLGSSRTRRSDDGEMPGLQRFVELDWDTYGTDRDGFSTYASTCM